MAQKSGFFNALLNGGVYDRKYNADDYCDNLAVVISSGVLRSAANDLKVTASGLNLSVGIGRAWIKGHYYNNTTVYSLPAVVPPTGGSRIDLVVLRFDNTVTARTITIEYKQGTAATSPVAPTLTRTDTVYELCLAKIAVDAGASTVSVTDTRADSTLCGWVYSVSGDGSFFESLDNEFETWFEGVKNTLSSVTLFKRYEYTETLSSASSTVTFAIPQYDADTCLLEVFVNGMLETSYTVSNKTITFSASLTAGTEVTVFCYKSIDGTGIMSVSDEITVLQNQVAALSGVSDFTYKATGSDDNISLSQIAQAIFAGEYNSADVTSAANAFLLALGGNTWLASLGTNAQVTIHVVGTLGVSTPVSGSGTTVSPYVYFDIGPDTHGSKYITFDFSQADIVEIEAAAGTDNVIFYGEDVDIRGLFLSVTSSGASCVVKVFMSAEGYVNCDSCKIALNISGYGRIANRGTFTNCNFRILSSADDAVIFAPNSDDLVRVIGGTFLAISGANEKIGAIFYTQATQTDAVAVAENINCPVLAGSGNANEYLDVTYAGTTIIDKVVTVLGSLGTYGTVTNKIAKNKSR